MLSAARAQLGLPAEAGRGKIIAAMDQQRKGGYDRLGQTTRWHGHTHSAQDGAGLGWYAHTGTVLGYGGTSTSRPLSKTCVFNFDLCCA